MEVNILEDSKEELKVELESVTIAELLRNYLNKDSAVSVAVWKRNHPTEKPALLVKTKGKTPKKAISDAISMAEKDLDKFNSDFNGLK